MKALTSRTLLALLGLAAVAAQASLGGTTYRLEVQTTDGLIQFEDCASFGADGELRLARAPLELAWSYGATSRAITFQATTASGHGSHDYFGLALHGRFLGQRALVADAVNEFGVTFRLRGFADATCTAGPSDGGAASSYDLRAARSPVTESHDTYAMRPIDSHWGPISFDPPVPPEVRTAVAPPPSARPLSLPLVASQWSPPCHGRECDPDAPRSLSDVATQPMRPLPWQAVRVDPCDVHPCDPPPDPTGETVEIRAIAGHPLAARSFDVRYDSGRSGTDCWTFGADGRLRTESGLDQVWRPAAGIAPAFQTSIDTVTGYYAVAFHGEWLDAADLRIDGIERWQGVTSTFVATATASDCVVLPAATTSGVHASFTTKVRR